MSQVLKPNSQPARSRPVSIRRADLNDLPAILRIEQSTSSAHWSADHYRSRIESQPDDACFLVAECCEAGEQSELCGFLCARIVAGEWEIENVIVPAAFRRQGIGAELMRSLIERWQTAGGTALLLEVRVSNAAARALYERYGFRETGRRTAYYRDPEESAVLYTLQRELVVRDIKA